MASQETASKRFTLASGINLVGAEALQMNERNRLGCADGDVIVERPTARRRAKLVNAATAELIEVFRTPRSLSEGIVVLARQLNVDSGELLDAAAPALDELIRDRILVALDDSSHPPSLDLRPGDRIGRFSLVRRVRRTDDIEVWLARDDDGTHAAVKVAVTGSDEALSFIQGELATLEGMSLSILPTVLESGLLDGRPYMALEWIEGVSASERSDEVRRMNPMERTALLNLCISVVEKYAVLHEAGVLHGDVKASNILIDRQDEVHLIDFAMSVSRAYRPDGRTWDYNVLEPEGAGAVLDGRIPPMTAAAEQFALGALLFRLVTGQAFRRPALDQRSALLEIVSRRDVPTLTSVGADSWPEMEGVLKHALDPQPGRRFPSTRHLLDSLQDISATPRRRRLRPSGLHDQLLESLGSIPDINSLIPSAPTASVHRGAAGLAWLLYRAAQVRADGVLLAHADVWARRARTEAGAPEGLVAPEFGVSAARAARSSPLHDSAGPLAVHCLVHAARLDAEGVEAAVPLLVEAMALDAELDELFMGEAGYLATAATVVDALRAVMPGTTVDLEAALQHRVERLTASVESGPAPADNGRLSHFGMAHGRAGLLYAILVAGDLLQVVPSAALEARLDELGRLAIPRGRGASWPGGIPRPGHARTPSHAPGWCSGSAGYVMLWLRAFYRYRKDSYHDLAARAAWNAWENPDNSVNLCCGLSGRAIALLGLYRLSGDEAWVERAAELLDRAERHLPGDTARSPWSLFRGEVGVAIALIEIERPARSVFPLIEPEGWSSPG